MQALIIQIEDLKKQLQELSPLKAEDQQRLDKKFRLEWNYNSNHLEGNTLTYGETELLLIFDQTKGNHEFREYEEMKGHDVALRLIEDLAKDKERNLTESFIREINRVILKEPFYKEAQTPDGDTTRKLIKIGEYKSMPNSVRLQNGEMFHYASPQETPALMHDLLEWYHSASNDSSSHPIETAAALHYRFVCIHPFDDGNGRISRLLMNYHLIKSGYPPVIIKSAEKKNYLFALHEADTGNMEAFYEYVAEQLLWSYEISIKAARSESIDEPGDLVKEIEVFKKRLNKSSNVSLEKSYDNLKGIWNNGLKKLLLGLSDSFTNYDSLFMRKSVNKFSNDSQRVETMLGKKLYEQLEIFDSIIDEHENKINQLNSIGLNFEWRGFNNSSTNIFDTYVNVKIVFDNFQYRIYSEPYSFPKKEFLYSQNLTDTDIDEIVTTLGREILEDIKQKTNAT